MLETLLFDLGNVLVHFSMDRWNAQLAELAGTTSAHVAEVRAGSDAISRYEHGRIDEDELQAWFEDAFDVRVDREDFERAYSDIFEPNADMVPVLDALRARGHRLVVLSNTSALHVEWVQRRFDVLERFDHLVCSHLVGAMKPHRIIFAEALRRIECLPERCLYTDDIERYVQAARSYGLEAEVFTTAPHYVECLHDRGISI